MAKALTLKLTPAQQQQLEQMRNRDLKPYLRERAAALLQIAADASACQVATQGLLKRRDDQTVAEWLRRYQKDGLKGLLIKTGRGRKPAFSPSAQRPRRGQSSLTASGQPGACTTPTTGQSLAISHRASRLRVAARALAGLRLAHPEAFGIRLKRGRDYLHSPDPHYLEKLADIMVALTQALTAKGRVVLVFLDECSF